MTASENMEFPTLRINLRDLNKIVGKLFNHIIETRGEDHIEIDKSFYWNIPSDELFDMKNKPQNIDVGSLADDWGFLSKLLDEKSIPVALQFAELATLFRVVGEKLGDKLAAKGG